MSPHLQSVALSGFLQELSCSGTFSRLALLVQPIVPASKLPAPGELQRDSCAFRGLSGRADGAGPAAWVPTQPPAERGRSLPTEGGALRVAHAHPDFGTRGEKRGSHR